MYGENIRYTIPFRRFRATLYKRVNSIRCHRLISSTFANRDYRNSLIKYRIYSTYVTLKISITSSLFILAVNSSHLIASMNIPLLRRSNFRKLVITILRISAYPISMLRIIKVALNALWSYYCCRSRVLSDNVSQAWRQQEVFHRHRAKVPVLPLPMRLHSNSWAFRVVIRWKR